MRRQGQSTCSDALAHLGLHARAHAEIDLPSAIRVAIPLIPDLVGVPHHHWCGLVLSQTVLRYVVEEIPPADRTRLFGVEQIGRLKEQGSDGTSQFGSPFECQSPCEMPLDW